MKKTWKRLSVMVLTGMLCMSTVPCAWAAGKAGSGKSVLSQYHAELANQRTELSRLISDSKELTQEVRSTQHSLKEAGLITKANCDRIADYSKSIKEKRVALSSLRGSNKELRADAKDARLAAEMNVAEDALTELQDLQDQQIELRSEIVKLLQEKLDFLKSIKAGKEVSTDEETGETTETAVTGEGTVSADASVTDQSTMTTETAAADGSAMTAETAAADGSTMTAETAVADGSTMTKDVNANDEIVTDEATLAAAFDDGAELEQE